MMQRNFQIERQRHIAAAVQLVCHPLQTYTYRAKVSVANEVPRIPRSLSADFQDGFMRMQVGNNRGHRPQPGIKNTRLVSVNFHPVAVEKQLCTGIFNPRPTLGIIEHHPLECHPHLEYAPLIIVKREAIKVTLQCESGVIGGPCDNRPFKPRHGVVADFFRQVTIDSGAVGPGQSRGEINFACLSADRLVAALRRTGCIGVGEIQLGERIQHFLPVFFPLAARLQGSQLHLGFTKNLGQVQLQGLAL